MTRQDPFNAIYSLRKDLPILHWSPEEGEISSKQNLKHKVPTAMEARLVFKKKYIPAAIYQQTNKSPRLNLEKERKEYRLKEIKSIPSLLLQSITAVGSWSTALLLHSNFQLQS